MKVTNTYEKTFSADEAQAWLEEYGYAHQRPLSKARVRMYRKQMESGEWLPGSPLKLVKIPGENGETQTQLLDGQHRLAALVETDKEIAFVVTEMEVASVAEAGEIYFTTDRARTRSTTDMFRVYELHKELGLSAARMNAVGAAVKLIYNNFQSIHRPENRQLQSDKEVLVAVQEYRPYIPRYFELIHQPAPGLAAPLQTAAPLAIGLVTLRYAVTVYGEGKVADFWDGVAHDNGLFQNDPRKVLVNHLIMTTMSRVNMEKTFVSSGYRCRAIASCFNAWVQNRNMTKIMVPDASGRIKILGTPFTGRQHDG